MSDFPGFFFSYTSLLGLVILYFMFYASSLIGFILTRVLRLWLGRGRYIRLGSVTFALLGGRVLLHDVTYVTRNTAIRAVDIIITVRWWRSEKEVRQPYTRLEGSDGEDVLSNRHLDSPAPSKPCRMSIEVSGLEYMMFNNTYAYDAVQDILRKRQNIADPIRDRLHEMDKDSVSQEDGKGLMARMFPAIAFYITRAAWMIGNNELQTMLVISMDRGEGVYTSAPARSRLDIYRSVLEVETVGFKAEVRPNPARHVAAEIRAAPHKAVFEDFLSGVMRDMQSFVKDIPHTIVGESTRKEEERHQAWTGLGHLAENVENSEYARQYTFLQAEKLLVIYYADVPGRIPAGSAGVFSPLSAPEFGVSLEFKGAKITYGPWTDRHRSTIQRFFYPWDYEPRPLYKAVPGNHRECAALIVNALFVDEVEFSIPFREQSKDHLFPGNDWRDRVPGSVSVSGGGGSAIRYVMPWVMVDHNGVNADIDIRLRQCVVDTSLNWTGCDGSWPERATLLRADAFDVNCSLGYPEVWNHLNDWSFSFEVDRPSIFLLMQHLYLFTDLVRDWTAGEPVDLTHFVPTVFSYRLVFRELDLVLNVNEQNLIEHPTDPTQNAHLTFHTPLLQGVIQQPFELFDAPKAETTFELAMNSMEVRLTLPEGNTIRQNMGDDNQETVFALAKQFQVVGSYASHYKINPAYLDSLFLEVGGRGVVVNLFGFFVKYFLCLQDNYFGYNYRCQTMEQYKARKRRLSAGIAEPTPPEQPHNSFELFVAQTYEDLTLVLPLTMFSARRSATARLHEANIETRLMPHYMDLYACLSPITLHVPLLSGEMDDSETVVGLDVARRSHLRVSDFSYRMHSMYGPAALGSHAFCSTTRTYIGEITGQLLPPQLLHLATWGINFGFTFLDQENRLSQELVSAVEPYNSTRKLNIGSIRVSIWGSSSVTDISLPDGMALDSDDLVELKYNSHTSVDLPRIVVKMLKASSNGDRWTEVAGMDCAFRIALLSVAPDRAACRTRQQEYLLRHDGDLHRLAWLWGDDADDPLPIPTDPVPEPPKLEIAPPPPPPALTVQDSSGIELQEVVVTDGPPAWLNRMAVEAHSKAVAGAPLTPAMNERKARMPDGPPSLAEAKEARQPPRLRTAPSDDDEDDEPPVPISIEPRPRARRPASASSRRRTRRTPSVVSTEEVAVPAQPESSDEDFYTPPSGDEFPPITPKPKPKAHRSVGFSVEPATLIEPVTPEKSVDDDTLRPGPTELTRTFSVMLTPRTGAGVTAPLATFGFAAEQDDPKPMVDPPAPARLAAVKSNQTSSFSLLMRDQSSRVLSRMRNTSASLEPGSTPTQSPAPSDTLRPSPRQTRPRVGSFVLKHALLVGFGAEDPALPMQGREGGVVEVPGDDNTMRSVVLVDARRTLDLFATPVALDVVEDLADALTPKFTSLESLLDDFQQRTVTDRSTYFRFPYQSSQFSFTIHRINARLVQPMPSSVWDHRSGSYVSTASLDRMMVMFAMRSRCLADQFELSKPEDEGAVNEAAPADGVRGRAVEDGLQGSVALAGLSVDVSLIGSSAQNAPYVPAWRRASSSERTRGRSVPPPTPRPASAQDTVSVVSMHVGETRADLRHDTSMGVRPESGALDAAIGHLAVVCVPQGAEAMVHVVAPWQGRVGRLAENIGEFRLLRGKQLSLLLANLVQRGGSRPLVHAGVSMVSAMSESTAWPELGLARKFVQLDMSSKDRQSVCDQLSAAGPMRFHPGDLMEVVLSDVEPRVRKPTFARLLESSVVREMLIDERRHAGNKAKAAEMAASLVPSKDGQRRLAQPPNSSKPPPIRLATFEVVFTLQRATVAVLCSEEDGNGLNPITWRRSTPRGLPASVEREPWRDGVLRLEWLRFQGKGKLSDRSQAIAALASAGANVSSATAMADESASLEARDTNPIRTMDVSAHMGVKLAAAEASPEALESVGRVFAALAPESTKPPPMSPPPAPLAKKPRPPMLQVPPNENWRPRHQRRASGGDVKEDPDSPRTRPRTRGHSKTISTRIDPRVLQSEGAAAAATAATSAALFAAMPGLSDTRNANATFAALPMSPKVPRPAPISLARTATMASLGGRVLPDAAGETSPKPAYLFGTSMMGLPGIVGSGMLYGEAADAMLQDMVDKAIGVRNYSDLQSAVSAAAADGEALQSAEAIVTTVRALANVEEVRLTATAATFAGAHGHGLGDDDAAQLVDESNDAHRLVTVATATVRSMRVVHSQQPPESAPARENLGISLSTVINLGAVELSATAPELSPRPRSAAAVKASPADRKGKRRARKDDSSGDDAPKPIARAMSPDGSIRSLESAQQESVGVRLLSLKWNELLASVSGFQTSRKETAFAHWGFLLGSGALDGQLPLEFFSLRRRLVAVAEAWAAGAGSLAGGTDAARGVVVADQPADITPQQVAARDALAMVPYTASADVGPITLKIGLVNTLAVRYTASRLVVGSTLDVQRNVNVGKPHIITSAKYRLHIFPHSLDLARRARRWEGGGQKKTHVSLPAVIGHALVKTTAPLPAEAPPPPGRSRAESGPSALQSTRSTTSLSTPTTSSPAHKRMLWARAAAAAARVRETRDKPQLPHVDAAMDGDITVTQEIDAWVSVDELRAVVSSDLLHGILQLQDALGGELDRMIDHFLAAQKEAKSADVAATVATEDAVSAEALGLTGQATVRVRGVAAVKAARAIAARRGGLKAVVNDSDSARAKVSEAAKEAAKAAIENASRREAAIPAPAYDRRRLRLAVLLSRAEVTALAPGSLAVVDSGRVSISVLKREGNWPLAKRPARGWRVQAKGLRLSLARTAVGNHTAPSMGAWIGTAPSSSVLPPVIGSSAQLRMSVSVRDGDAKLDDEVKQEAKVGKEWAEGKPSQLWVDVKDVTGTMPMWSVDLGMSLASHYKDEFRRFDKERQALFEAKAASYHVGQLQNALALARERRRVLEESLRRMEWAQRESMMHCRLERVVLCVPLYPDLEETAATDQHKQAPTPQTRPPPPPALDVGNALSVAQLGGIDGSPVAGASDSLLTPKSASALRDSVASVPSAPAVLLWIQEADFGALWGPAAPGDAQKGGMDQAGVVVTKAVGNLSIGPLGASVLRSHVPAHTYTTADVIRLRGGGVLSDGSSTSNSLVLQTIAGEMSTLSSVVDDVADVGGGDGITAATNAAVRLCFDGFSLDADADTLGALISLPSATPPSSASTHRGLMGGTASSVPAAALARVRARRAAAKEEGVFRHRRQRRLMADVSVELCAGRIGLTSASHPVEPAGTPPVTRRPGGAPVHETQRLTVAIPLPAIEVRGRRLAEAEWDEEDADEVGGESQTDIYVHIGSLNAELGPELSVVVSDVLDERDSLNKAWHEHHTQKGVDRRRVSEMKREERHKLAKTEAVISSGRVDEDGAASSLLLSFDPINVTLTCAPASQVRCEMWLKAGQAMASSVTMADGSQRLPFSNFTATLPEAGIRLFHPYSPANCLRLAVTDTQLSLGTSLTRGDRTATRLFVVKSVVFDVSVRNMAEFFMFMQLWERRGTAVAQPPPSAAAAAPPPPPMSDGVAMLLGLVDRLDITADLGQNVGRCHLIAVRGTLRRCDTVHCHRAATSDDEAGQDEEESVVWTGALDSLDVVSQDRLVGDAGVADIQVSGAWRGVPSWASQDPYGNWVLPLNRWALQVGPAFANVEYNLERVVRLHSGDSAFRFRDSLGGLTSDVPGLRVFGDVSNERISVLSSRETLPAFMKIASRVKDSIDKKQVLARQTLLTASDGPIASSVVVRSAVRSIQKQTASPAKEQPVTPPVAQTRTSRRRHHSVRERPAPIERTQLASAAGGSDATSERLRYVESQSVRVAEQPVVAKTPAGTGILPLVLPAVPVGEVTVVGRELNLFFFGNSLLRDAEWANASQGHYEATLIQRTDVPPPEHGSVVAEEAASLKVPVVTRQLALIFSDTAASKMTEGRGRVGGRQSTDGSAGEGEDDVIPRSIRDGNVDQAVRLPKASIVMYTRQAVGFNTLEYYFRSHFPEPITISLNVNVYLYLRGVATLYMEELKSTSRQSMERRNLRAVEESGVSGRVSAAERRRRRRMPAVSDPIVAPSRAAEKKPLPPPGTAEAILETVSSRIGAKADADARQYKQLKYDLKPQLDVLGSWTPDVDTFLGWIGISDKGTIPKAVHSSVTDPMESLLLTLMRWSVAGERARRGGGGFGGPTPNPPASTDD